MMPIKHLLPLLVILLSHIIAIGQQTVPSSVILHDIHRLNTIGSVLYIAAHPDDENTRLISYLTKDLKVDVSYLSLTRGDGGQNLVGTEIGEGLGLLRTHELLTARNIDGGQQYFTRAVDFGYSKTADETLKIWEEDKVLSDMVFVIRKVRPDVIITRFSPDENPERSTHGHHTASAKLALLAFEYAADETKYPEQLKYYPVHTTQKLFWNTSYWFYGSQEKMDEEVAKNPNKYVKINANTYLPHLGQNCSDISAMSRSQHKSQGFGSAPSLDDQLELLQLLKGKHQGNTLFEGLPLKWSETTYGKMVAKKIDVIVTHFDLNAPDKSLDDLFALREMLTILQSDNKASTHANSALIELDEIIVQCMGLRITAYTPNRKYHVDEQVEVAIDAVAYCPNGTVALEEIAVHNLNFGIASLGKDLVRDGYHTKWTGRISQDQAYSQPFWLQMDQTLGSYTLPNDPLLALANISPYAFHMKLNLTVNGKAFTYYVPVLHGKTDPVKGLITQPIIIIPNVMLNLDQEVYIFAGNTAKKITVEMISGQSEIEGYVELNLPKGWISNPVFYPATTGAKGDKQLFVFQVTPPANQISGKVRAMYKTKKGLHTEGNEVYTVGINELLYDHVPNTAWFPTSEATIQKIVLEKKGNSVGYLMGAGDKVPEALREMGYSVTLITVDDILQKPLTFDAILIGIRAFNTLENIENAHDKLMKFVENGGNVVVQYNTAHALKSKRIGPYDITLSRERVTEEDAEVTILKPQHMAMITPNKITPSDFENWVQERGLYFPNAWDDHYEALLSIHDAGESDLRGSLLIASYGKGYFVYTGLSFFRELPAGVPGAYRLMANLISLGK